MFAGMAETGLPTAVACNLLRIGATCGALENKVTTSQRLPPWTLGIAALMRNLARCELLPEP
jgi:fumarylacetoacetate (FAA) hydrolase family protein